MTWERIANIIIKFSVGVFIIGGLVLIILSFHPETWIIYGNPLFMGFISILSGIILCFPKIIFHKSWIKKIYSPHLLYFVQFILLIGLILNAFGALGFYLNLKYYDSVVHFIDGIIFSFGLYFLYLIYPDPRNAFKTREQRKALFFTLFIFFGFALLWEFYEYYGDIIFKTQMFGEPGEKIDTQIDLIATTLGSVIGIIIAHFNAKKLIRYFSTYREPRRRKILSKIKKHLTPKRKKIKK